MNLLNNLTVCFMILCLMYSYCWSLNNELPSSSSSSLSSASSTSPTYKIRHKRDAFRVLIKKKGLKAAAAGLVAAASISKKKFFPVPIPFKIPILKPPIVEAVPVPIGLANIGGIHGGIGGFGHGGGGFGGFGGGGFGYGRK